MSQDAHRSSRAWLIAGGIFAVVATALLVLSDDARWLRLGIVAALWAAFLGGFLATHYRRQADRVIESMEDAQAMYELELEREVAARREHELQVEADAKQAAEETARKELDALRHEVATLRETLQKLMGGDVLYERVALTAQSTRVRSLRSEPKPKTIEASPQPNGAETRKGLRRASAMAEQHTEAIDRVLDPVRTEPAPPKPPGGARRPAGPPINDGHINEPPLGPRRNGADGPGEPALARSQPTEPAPPVGPPAGPVRGRPGRPAPTEPPLSDRADEPPRRIDEPTRVEQPPLRRAEPERAEEPPRRRAEPVRAEEPPRRRAEPVRAEEPPRRRVEPVRAEEPPRRRAEPVGADLDADDAPWTGRRRQEAPPPAGPVRRRRAEPDGEVSMPWLAGSEPSRPARRRAADDDGLDRVNGEPSTRYGDEDQPSGRRALDRAGEESRHAVNPTLPEAARQNLRPGGRRRKPEPDPVDQASRHGVDEPWSDGSVTSLPSVEPDVADDDSGSHAEGRSVAELLAAYGDVPRRRRRRD